MARLNLATRAGRIQPLLKNRDLEHLPKTVQKQLDLFTASIGVSTDTFIQWAPSTRTRYIRAAKRGYTVMQERARVKVQREAAGQRRIARKSDPRIQRILNLREQIMAEGFDDEAGPDTHTDKYHYQHLYSDVALNTYIRTYGVTKVTVLMEQQLDAIQQYNRSLGIDRSVGQTHLRAATGSIEASEYRQRLGRQDERWFWYHTRLY